MRGVEMAEILIGSILLDVNRWGNPKAPTYEVSAWTDRFKEAGFDGIELWEYHATLCSDAERDRLIASDFPSTLYNMYSEFDDASEAGRQVATEMITKLGSRGVKFNVGKDPALRAEYLKNLRAWREAVPDSCMLMCECHPGTIVEEPEAAKEFFDALGVDGWEVMVHCFIPEQEVLKRWFDQFGDKVGQAHVQMRDDGRNILRLDEDPDRAQACLTIMYDAGFSGAYTIEFAKGTREPGENMDDLWTAAKADLDFLRSHTP
ncbi:MAG: sugar phosphate isomerase/epimerase [Candidatus Latescibacterota bacterium]|jgi:sugar phosphate isomerase/epimerase